MLENTVHDFLLLVFCDCMWHSRPWSWDAHRGGGWGRHQLAALHYVVQHLTGSYVCGKSIIPVTLVENTIRLVASLMSLPRQCAMGRKGWLKAAPLQPLAVHIFKALQCCTFCTETSKWSASDVRDLQYAGSTCLYKIIKAIFQGRLCTVCMYDSPAFPNFGLVD